MGKRRYLEGSVKVSGGGAKGEEEKETLRLKEEFRQGIDMVGRGIAKLYKQCY